MYRLLSVYVIPLFILIPIITGIVKYKYLTAALKIMFFYMVFAGVMNLLNSISMVNHHSSALLFNIFTIVEFVLISLFYLKLFGPGWRIPIMGITIAFVTFSSTVDFLMSTHLTLGAYTKTVEEILALIYGILYISRQAQLNIDKSWGAISTNWINIAFLIYFATTLLMFALYPFLLKAPMAIIAAFWFISDAVLVLEYILFAVAFNKAKTERGL